MIAGSGGGGGCIPDITFTLVASLHTIDGASRQAVIQTQTPVGRMHWMTLWYQIISSILKSDVRARRNMLDVIAKPLYPLHL